MELEEFRQEFINEDVCIPAMTSRRYPEDVFIDCCIDIFQDVFSFASEMAHTYFIFKEGNRAYKSMRLDASCFDRTTSTLYLLIADYNDGDLKNITNSTIDYLSKQLLSFFENSAKGFFDNAELSDPAVQLAHDIKRSVDEIQIIHLFIVSTDKLSKSVKTLKLGNFNYGNFEYKVILDVLDIEKIYRAKISGFKKEALVINCADFGIEGIPCIKADIQTDQYESYLAIVPGQFLAEIYHKYGMALLESNVRSFLKFNGKINKGIRETILHEKSRFFTYNNGVSITAKDVNVKTTPNGMLITGFTDLQIINGGQTTAALAFTQRKNNQEENENLSGIFVQMKLTVLNGDDPELICNIAKYANSQNKVNNADLNSSHAFYVRMENISRKMYTPIVSGELNQTLWFFERIRGQYEQPLMQMATKKQRDEYKLLRPKKNKFTLTDLSKYMNAADMYPHYVSWGGEVSSTFFHERMKELWNKDNRCFDELFYKELIGKKIFFSFIEGNISNQSWYQEKRAYRPQLIAYTFSKIVYEAKKIKKLIDYKAMWDSQSVPECYCKDVVAVAKKVFDAIYDEKRSTANIETYCKKEECWSVIQKIECTLSKDVQDVMVTQVDADIERTNAQQDHQLEGMLNDELAVFEKGRNYWISLLNHGVMQKVINTNDEATLKIAIDYCDQIKMELTKEQLENIYTVIAKLKENGIE